mgnify:CR=1 FL=1
MEFNVNSKLLEKLLSRVIPAVPSRTPNPMLENFLLKIKDGSLTVCATDNELMLSSSLNVDASEDEDMVVPARLLYDIVRSLKDTMINIKAEPNAKLSLTTDNGVYTISYASTDDFPLVPVVSKDRKVSLNGSELRFAIEQTSFAMSKEDMRPAMTGSLFEFTKEGLRFVSTDGHRLVKFLNQSINADFEEQYIIPERAISILPKMLGDSDVTILLSKTHAAFLTGDIELITKLISEKYPAYNSVIPLENENILKVKTQELHDAVKRMMLFSTTSTKQVKFSISKELLEVSAEDIDHGANAKESISCEYNGEPMDIGFNSAYVNDVLMHNHAKEVVFKLSSPTKACIIEPAEQEENHELMMLLMPVRLNT